MVILCKNKIGHRFTFESIFTRAVSYAAKEQHRLKATAVPTDVCVYTCLKGEGVLIKK